MNLIVTHTHTHLQLSVGHDGFDELHFYPRQYLWSELCLQLLRQATAFPTSQSLDDPLHQLRVFLASQLKL